MVQNSVTYDKQSQRLICQDKWNLESLPELQKNLYQIQLPTSGKIIIDGAGITTMDVAGAWLLNTWIKTSKKKSLTFSLENFSSQSQSLLELVENRAVNNDDVPTRQTLSWIERIGKNAWIQILGFRDYLSFLGKLTTEAMRVIVHPTRIRWKEIAATIDKTGYQALFIIALLSFMIGVVITYQMGLQLRNYGANIFIVDLLGLSILREFGPLITAIMVAGRTGSSYTAQLGMMKINQEIDALDTMGVTPGELLVLPRVTGLLIALPLLTMWADIFGVLGGIMMSNNMLNIPPYDFLNRFEHEIPVRALIIGLCKAPVFALIISTIGCFQGMTVQGSADSVGRNTTRSVVLGIFFIIVADAIFSILFSKFQL
jgi:phospholipid/cholesterol/gamma-HCH transport system permease protein